MIAFDVGANVGYYTLLLARRVGPKGLVIAFEPNPSNLIYLKQHLRLNKIDNVKIVEAAVDDKEGVAFFSGSGSMGKLSQAGFSVNSVILDNYPRPDFIKMDIEGGETAALRGSTKILAEGHALWFIALHGPAHTQTPELLLGRNYTVEWITDTEICARPCPNQPKSV
jgi:FkbM family methyltransferase